MDKLLQDAWKKHLDAKTPEEATKFFNIGYKTGSAPLTLKTLQDRDYLMPMNLSWFNPINKKYREDVKTNELVGIINQGGIVPADVIGGKCGAGSEIALVRLAEELAKRGYHVYVFHGGETNIDSVPCKNPQYLPIASGKERELGGCGGPGFVRSYEGLIELGEKRLDHLILWRYRENHEILFNSQTKNLYLSCHDFCDIRLAADLKAIVVLSECHKSHFQSQVDHVKYVVGCNGTAYKPETKLRERKPLRCCYASSYSRGLKTLLEIWPRLLEAVPGISLHIYYGRETFGVLNDSQINEIVKLIESNKSVVEHGKVPHDELVLCLSECDFLLYPYEGMSETFSITTVTSMQVGCIPIVRKKDALAEVMSIQEQSLLDNDSYVKYAIEMLTKPREELEEYRNKCREHAKDYTHAKAADVYIQTFNAPVEVKED